MKRAVFFIIFLQSVLVYGDVRSPPKTCVEVLEKVDALMSPFVQDNPVNDVREHELVRSTLKYYVDQNLEFDPDVEWIRSMKRIIAEKQIFQIGTNEFLQPVEVLPHGKFRALTLSRADVLIDEPSGQMTALHPLEVSFLTQALPLFQYINPHGRDGRPTGTLDVQHGQLVTFAAMAVSAKPEVNPQNREEFFADVYISLYDRGLLSFLFPALKNATSSAQSHREFYEKLAKKLGSLLNEPLIYADRSAKISLPIGERVACYGGVCRQGTLLTYLYLNLMTDIRAHMILSLPASLPTGHGYIVTGDGYIIDPLYGIAFKPMTKKGLVTLPPDLKLSLRKEFPDQKAWQQAMSIMQFHYAAGARNSPIRKRSKLPFRDLWVRANIFPSAP